MQQQRITPPAPGRRRLLGGIAATAIAGVSCDGDARRQAQSSKLLPQDTRVYDGPPPPRPVVRYVPMPAEVAVPRDLLGMHFHRWPFGGSPAPTFPFDTVRSLNYDPARTAGGLHWNRIERAEGEFDWKLMDGWVDTHFNAGRRLIFTFYGTPRWCSTSALEDPYHSPGGDSKPADLRYVARFITELVKRYNSQTRKIACLEIWNEPNFYGAIYWRNSAADLAAIGRTLYQAAKAVDPGITILWPAFVNWLGKKDRVPNLFPESHQAYARASDGADGTGLKWADAFNFHFYQSQPTTDLHDFMNHQDSMLAVRNSLIRPDWDIYLSEIGILDGIGEKMTSEQIATLIRRWVMFSAAYGNRFIGLYSYESATNLGDPAHNPVVSAAISDIHGAVPGKRITRAGMLDDGRAWIVFSDMSTLVH